MRLKLMLGTAQWGWNMDKQSAFSMLDAWLKAGLSEVDAATNYPINRQAADFRASEKILTEYIAAHGLSGELSVTMKVGSMNNMRSPEINLSSSFLRMISGEYQRLLGENLGGIMIHWDNRDDVDEIRATVAFLSELSLEGIRPGLSGIKYPAHYVKANEVVNIPFDIEVKHNILASDLQRYQAFMSDDQLHRIWAYGINAGGIKLKGNYSSDSTFTIRGGDSALYNDKCAQIERMLPEWNLAFVRPPILTMHHIGLLLANSNPKIHGVVLGTKNAAQLTETLDFLRNLEVFDYEDIVKSLRKLI